MTSQQVKIDIVFRKRAHGAQSVTKDAFDRSIRHADVHHLGAGGGVLRIHHQVGIRNAVLPQLPADELGPMILAHFADDRDWITAVDFGQIQADVQRHAAGAVNKFFTSQFMRIDESAGIDIRKLTRCDRRRQFIHQTTTDKSNAVCVRHHQLTPFSE